MYIYIYILPGGDHDWFSINDELPVLVRDGALVLAVHRVVLEHVDHVLHVDERICTVGLRG